MKIKIIAVIVILVLVLFVNITACNKGGSSMKNTQSAANNSSNSTLNQGEEAKAFELKGIDGKVYKLSDFKGKKLYIKAWASWCSICLAGLDEIDKLYTLDRDFEIVTVVAPGKRGEKDSKAFTEWFKSLDKKNIIVLLDEKGDFTKNYGIRAYPTSIFIGSDGIVTENVAGQRSNEDIISMYKKIK